MFPALSTRPACAELSWHYYWMRGDLYFLYTYIYSPSGAKPEFLFLVLVVSKSAYVGLGFGSALVATRSKMGKGSLNSRHLAVLG